MNETLPPPRRARHYRTLLWWLALAVVLMVASWNRGNHMPGFTPSAPLAGAAPEQEAFVGFVFGKVSAEGALSISPALLRAQLKRLKESGAHVVTLSQIKAFLDDREALPAKPVLLAFDEARRE